MAGLHQTITRLSRYRRTWEGLSGEAARRNRPADDGLLQEVAEFGANPGRLRMFEYVPPRTGAPPALVVILHGCTQNAAGYDRGAGWSKLAERHGFAILAPEQQAENNPNACFTWFEPGTWQRGAAEAASIRQMIARMTNDHRIDGGRVFVTGLSAGGAMANVMLATSPELFSAGAIIAGLPYGAASDVPSAFDAMFKGRRRTAAEWGDLVRAASAHEGPWPRVSIWHGGSDRTVVPANGQESVKQWIAVHGLSPGPRRTEAGQGYSREVWSDARGRAVVEHVSIPGMAHGTPLSPGDGEDACGEAGPFLLDVGVSSTHHIARFFGLIDTVPAQRNAAAFIDPAAVEPPEPPQDAVPNDDEPAAGHPPDESRQGPIDIGATIRQALSAAGLLRKR